MKRIQLYLALAAIGWLASGEAAASGFALIEQSASGLGNAYAGGAAAAEDASTIFFNPAGMARISGRQLVVAAHAIRPSAKFSNLGSSGALGADSGGDAGSWVLMPNFYYTADLNSQWKYGLGINSPFGLKTEYAVTWMGRLQGIKSALETININPGVSYKMSDTVMLGAGVSAQHLKAELTNAYTLGGAVAIMKGSSWGYGFNLGALFQTTSSTRVGASYRSAVKQDLSGDLTFSATPVLNGAATAGIRLPDTLSLSVFSQIDPKLEAMADLTWTKWSHFKRLDVFKNGALATNTIENWRDTYRISAGASYRYNDQWKSRFGLAFDRSPVPDIYRTVRIPDNDRTWLSIGGQYKVSLAGALDFGYAHLFVKRSSLDQTVAARLYGNYKNAVDILSIQYTHNF